MLGEFGPRGISGVPGATGPTGATGVDPVGPTGATGNIPGVDGEQGPDGAIGPSGLPGPTGPSGVVGDIGEPGDPTKTAILETTFGPRSFYCIEAPSAFFEDTFTVYVSRPVHLFRPDPVFVSVCEPETLFVSAHSCDSAVPYNVSLQDGSVRVSCTSLVGHTFCVTVRGLRRGETSRFKERTETERRANNAFWRSA